MHDCIVRNIRLLGPRGWQEADLAVDQGRFSAIGNVSEAGREVVDGKGSVCFPGGVDLHVHFNEPGRTHWEGFATGSLAAAAGGCTFVAEMPLNSIPSTTSVEALEEKLASIGSKSRVDFALWGGLVPGNLESLQPLADAGVIAFKAFMSPSGTEDFINSDIATLKAGMKRIAPTGKFLAIHAEDPAVLDKSNRGLSQRKSAFDWEASRPVEAEISAIQIAIELAGDTDCPIHIVHVSSAQALATITEAKSRGVNVTCETCPHYLLLSTEDADRIGPDAKCAPPLRYRDSIDALWQSLSNGEIDTIGSDHSPCPPEMKSGLAFYDAWGGISGLQHGLPLLWSHRSESPELLALLVQLSSTGPSKRAGLDAKGFIEIDKDADFVLVDSSPMPRKIKADNLVYKHRTSAYCGMQTTLEVRQTWLRGSLICENGKAIGDPSGAFCRGQTNGNDDSLNSLNSAP